jgi:hypothetical protein
MAQQFCFWEEKPFSCIWCDVKFNSIQAIEIHVRHKHKYNCNDCIKEFALRCDFIKHAKQCPSAQKHVAFYVGQYFK